MWTRQITLLSIIIIEVEFCIWSLPFNVTKYESSVIIKVLHLNWVYMLFLFFVSFSLSSLLSRFIFLFVSSNPLLLSLFLLHSRALLLKLSLTLIKTLFIVVCRSLLLLSRLALPSRNNLHKRNYGGKKEHCNEKPWKSAFSFFCYVAIWYGK